MFNNCRQFEVSDNNMFNNCRQFEVSDKDLKDSNCLRLLNIVIKKLRLFDFVIIHHGPLRKFVWSYIFINHNPGF